MNKELILSEIKSLNERVDGRPYFGIYANGMSIDNPLAWMWGDDKTLVNEGLVKTYPIEACKKHMMNFFGFSYNDFIIHNNADGTCSATLVFPCNGDNYANVVKAMDLYGYYPAIKDEKRTVSNGLYHMTFEPKFQKNANALLKTEKYLFHITPKVYKDKILKNGFVPYSRNNRNDYPPRIFFILGSNNPIDTLQMAKKLSTVKYQNEDNLDKYCAFRIDVSKLPDNVTFHIDPNKGGAVWTSDNISPSCIDNVIDLHN